MAGYLGGHLFLHYPLKRGSTALIASVLRPGHRAARHLPFRIVGFQGTARANIKFIGSRRMTRTGTVFGRLAKAMGQYAGRPSGGRSVPA